MLPHQFAAADLSWATDRDNLWNAAERAEVRKDARVAREYLVALPAELSPQGRIDLVAGFSRELVERFGFALDIAIHAPRAYQGSDPRNFHAHLLATTREVTREGLGAKTSLEWSDTHRRQAGLGPAVGELRYVREQWALAANTALERENINQRIDHRTLQAQGIDREPRPHIPHAAFEIERHGHRSVVAERIRAEYEARVQARLQRAPQHDQPAGPQSLKEKVKEAAESRFQYRQAQGPKKSSAELSKEALLKWAQYREKQGPGKSPDELAKEAVLKWAALYGPEARALREKQGQEQAREREQKEQAPASPKRARQIDHDLSL